MKKKLFDSRAVVLASARVLRISKFYLAISKSCSSLEPRQIRPMNVLVLVLRVLCWSHSWVYFFLRLTCHTAKIGYINS